MKIAKDRPIDLLRLPRVQLFFRPDRRRETKQAEDNYFPRDEMVVVIKGESRLTREIRARDVRGRIQPTACYISNGGPL